MANQGEIVVCFGYSQSGKTTWFNAATNSNLPVGDGAGGSATSVPTLAFSPVYNRPVVDVPGLDDTRLTVTNEEAALQVASVVAETHIERAKFLVFENMQNGSTQLPLTLDCLSHVFSPAVLPSVVVLASKMDRLEEEHRYRRLSELRRQAAARGINEVIPWTNQQRQNGSRDRITDDQRNIQERALQDALHRVPTATVASFHDVNRRVQAVAQQLCDAAGPRMISQWRDQPQIENYQVQEQQIRTQIVMRTQTETREYQVRGEQHPLLQAVTFGLANLTQPGMETRTETTMCQ